MDEVVFFNLVGFPNTEKFKEICLLLDEAGCKFMEIGIPSSNPFKDGQEIANIHKEIKDEITSEQVQNLLVWLKENTNLKIVLMTYFDGFKDYELDKIPTNLYSSILCIDNDLNEYPSINKVRFYRDDMNTKELTKNIESNSDFCYVNSGNSETGGILGSPVGFVSLLERLRPLTKLPLYVGFGVKTQEHVKLILENGADGAIVGSEFIKRIQKDENGLVYLKEYLEELTL